MGKQRQGWLPSLSGVREPLPALPSSAVPSPHTERTLQRAPCSLCHTCLKLFKPHPCPPMRPCWSASVARDQCHSILSTLQLSRLLSVPQFPHFTPGEGGSPLRCTWGKKCTQLPFTKSRCFPTPSTVCCASSDCPPVPCPHFQGRRPTLGGLTVPWRVGGSSGEDGGSAGGAAGAVQAASVQGELRMGLGGWTCS